jgi:hypothetical protein
MIVNLNVASEALTEALTGRTCGSAWLGYGNPLFLAFGKTSYEELTLRGRVVKHRVAEYKVTTYCADWSLETAGPPVSIFHMDDALAKEAAHALIGRQVSGWQLIDGHGLQIDFEGGIRLRVLPWMDEESVGSDTEAWCVTLPGNRIVAVSCDGRVVAVDSEMPICDWFTRDNA